MRMRVGLYIGLGIAVTATVLLVAGNTGVSAGPLTPPGAPAPSSVTLNEMDAKLSQSLGLSTVPGYIPPSSPPGLISGNDGRVATSILLTVNGAVQGKIEGSVETSGYEGTIAVLDIEHEVTTERDAASGLPTGKRQHKPVSVLKPIDKATPLLYRVLTTNEVLESVTLQYFRDGDGGKREQFYTIELENARIASIVTSYPNREHVSFVYQKITWTWADGSITAEDDWATPTG